MAGLFGLTGTFGWTGSAAAEPERHSPQSQSPMANATPPIPAVMEPTQDPEPTQSASQETPSDQAQSSDSDTFAQRHWHSGMAYLEEGDYAKALEAFTKAYELSERPSLLRSIAVAHEKLGDLESAIAAIDLYLRHVPDAPDVNDIRTYRAQLQARYDNEQTEDARAESAAAAESANAQVRAPSGPYVLLEPELPSQPAAVHDTSAREVVMWSALGVAVVAGASASITGLQARSKFEQLDKRCNPMCTRRDTHEGRTLALASTVLTGVAVLAGGALVWVWLDDPEPDSANPSSTTSLVPQLNADYADSRFMSYANWSF